MLFAPKEQGNVLIEFAFAVVFLLIIFYMLMVSFKPEVAAKMRFWE